MTDLVLRGGRVIDPASGRDETADIAFGGGKVAEIGRDLRASGAEIVDVRGLLVVPGLIDLHTHVYRGRTSLVQSNGARPEIKFALDSPVEERRFEPSVPP